MEQEEDGHLDPEVVRWVQEVADRDYGGNWGRAVAAMVEGVYAREHRPGDTWAELDARMRLSDRGRRSR